MVRAKRIPASLLPVRPRLEGLEDRCLLSNNVLQTNLVSDLPGVAQFMDPHLVNPWGISESGNSAFWISDNNAGLSTLYNTQGVKQGLEVSIPTPGDPTGSTGAPTGTVFNTTLADSTPGFNVTDGTHTMPAIFLFATEDGTIVGWNPGVNPPGSDPAKAGTFGTIALDNSIKPTPADGAVYKGLTIATDSTGRTLLYAANFRSGKVEAFAKDFSTPTNLATNAFTDPNLPKGYAPFDVQALNGKIYVTYALQNSTKHDDVAGLGHGFVDVFNLDGSPGLAGNKMRLVSRGALDSPWGLAIAPPSFGSLAGALLVGNFGDGKINVYNATTPGDSIGQLKDPDGEAIHIDGLWALKVGNGGMGGDPNKVYFTAGLDHEAHGLFGSLSFVAPGTPEGPAEAQAIVAAADVVQINATTVAQDIANGVSGATLRQAIHNLNVSLVQLAQAEQRFADDQRDDQSPSGGDRSASALAHHSEQDALDAVFADLGSLDQDFS
jgi:uncharacterized protein (TIGR03118 family)